MYRRSAGCSWLSGLMAPTGQAARQAPWPTHASGLMRRARPSVTFRHGGVDYFGHDFLRSVRRELAALLADPYFDRPSPKSTGRDLFNMPWLERQLATQPPFNQLPNAGKPLSDSDVLTVLEQQQIERKGDNLEVEVPITIAVVVSLMKPEPEAESGFDAAQRVLNQLLIEKSPVKVLAQERVVQAQHLVRQQPVPPAVSRQEDQLGLPEATLGLLPGTSASTSERRLVTNNVDVLGDASFQDSGSCSNPLPPPTATSSTLKIR